jgi:hypothetical protein
MISAYGLFGTIRDTVRRAVESFDDVSLIDEWELFLRCLSVDDCSILCVSGSGEVSYLPSLRAVAADAGKGAEYATYPLVVVDLENSLQGELSHTEWRALPWTIVTGEEIEHLGTDAIPRDPARGRASGAGVSLADDVAPVQGQANGRKRTACHVSFA